MPPERPNRIQVELTPEPASGYAATFIHRFDTYPMQNADGSYVRVKRPLTNALLEGHLKGHITLGAYALDARSQAHWVCLDADDPERFQQIRRLAAALAGQDIPSYLEQSHRGGHLWIFTPPLSGSDARRFGKQLLIEHEIDPKTIELFPKQDWLITGVGSLVRLPLGVHQLSKQRYAFLSPTGQYLGASLPEQMHILTHPSRVSDEIIRAALARAPEAKPVFPTQPFIPRPKNRIVGETPSERIKNRIGVFDFVSQYVELDASGRGFCPFHDDHRMSFGVNQEANYWNCFAACGDPRGGSVIDFWMRWREMHGQSPDFTGTLTDLIQLLDL